MKIPATISTIVNRPATIAIVSVALTIVSTTFAFVTNKKAFDTADAALDDGASIETAVRIAARVKEATWAWWTSAGILGIQLAIIAWLFVNGSGGLGTATFALTAAWYAAIAVVVIPNVYSIDVLKKSLSPS